jgi:hypothetical protein
MTDDLRGVATGADRMELILSSHYVLFRCDGAVKVADATSLIGNHFPRVLMVAHREYRIISSEDTFFFWDELIDGDDRTVGFMFLLPCSPTLRSSRLLSDSTNTSVDGAEVRIDLCPGVSQQWDCVQGFGSKVYQAADDPADCAILMMNWSGRSAGFEVVRGAVHAIA